MGSGGWSFAAAETTGARDEESCTSLMLRDLPSKCSRMILLKEIKNRGFINDIDFFHLPIDVRRKRAVRYCFINLTTAEAACRFRTAFDGTVLTGVKNNCTFCHVVTGNVQGLEANIAAYQERDSPSLHLGEEYQPLLFHNGRSRPLRVGQKHDAIKEKQRGAVGVG